MEVKVDSNRIRTERENRGWSQGHLADVAGLSLRTIQRIEKTGSASFESVTALAAILSIDVADLRAAESEPKRPRAIRLSLELPIRLALAVVSGILCAFHFRSSYFSDWGSPDFGFQWFDFGIAGGLFAVTVLCPYLRPGNGLILRSLGLIGASALSYFCAILILEGEDWLPIESEFGALMLASAVGVSIVLVAARFLIPLQVTARYWFLGLAASIAGAAAMYVGLEIFDFSPVSMAVSYSAWHVFACVAIYYGHRSSDAENGMLATLVQARGRFSIVPGWMRLEHRRAAAACPG